MDPGGPDGERLKLQHTINPRGNIQTQRTIHSVLNEERYF